QAGDVVHLGPVQDARDVIVDAMGEAADAVAKGVEIAADHGHADAAFQRRGEHRGRPTTGNSHAADAAGVELGPGRNVVDRPHDVPDAPSDHRLPDHQGAAGDRLAGFVRQSLPRVDRIAPAAEAHRLDGHGGHTGFNHLNGEVVLIAGFVHAIPPLLVDADDVVDSAA